MKALKRDLQSVIKSLNLLTIKAEKIAEALEKIDAPQPAKKSVAKTASRPAKKSVAKTAKKTATKKEKPETATELVLKIIKKRKKGIDTATLQEKTNFDAIKVRNIIFRLKRQKKIKSEARGIYVAI